MKKIVTILLCFMIVLTIASCGKENVFNATIVQFKSEGTMTVAPDEDSDEYGVADRIYLSPEKIDIDQFSVGDRISVVYKGKIQESYPAMIDDISSITLIDPDELGDITPDYRELVMVNGIMYVSTGEESTVEARCGTPDGHITSSVTPDLRPLENDQSNFGANYDYQYCTEDTIEVHIDGKWIVFKAE